MSKQGLQLIRPEIQALSAYHVPDPGDLIKLDAMENPYSLPEELVQQWLSELADAPLNRYPDPAAKQLTNKIRQYMEVPSESELMLGNGSDELIQIIAMSVARSGQKIMAPDPGFVMYKMISIFVGMDYIGVPLKDDFSLDMSAMLAGIKQHQPAIIFLAYPNNPTGNLFDEADIIEILNAAEGLVVVDEAYHPFACTSFMNRLNDFENLLVMRTVSKMGLAGLRLGVLAGSKILLNEFDKVRLPYNINVLTQISALFALQHADIFEEQAASIRQQRTWLFNELKTIDDFDVYPSAANFILVRLKKGGANQVFEALKKSGVLIKNLNSAGGMLTECLRITVGTVDENQVFIQALKKII
ncbi:MAG: histidinol-phosphate transaminase [Gammaproteobacteria bacterium]|nr:histidinol-phosphate transaminase [Gammaproteobacteria bacterium]